MDPFATVLAVCVLGSAVAFPGSIHGGWNQQQLTGVPGLSSYGKLSYPKYDLIDLGSSSHGSLPPTIVHINTHETVSIPKPYPIEVPVKVPYPVHIPKPYPVVETKLIKVPVEVPVEVVKKIPVPIEVPKPYPVPVESHGGYGQQGFGGGHGLAHLSHEGSESGSDSLYQSHTEDEY